MRPLYFFLPVCTLFSFFVCKAQTNCPAPVCMYPGDANNDGMANHFDLLPVGVAYNTPGPERPNAVLNWIKQPAPSWETFLPVSNIDLAFVDGNGQSVIDAKDIPPIAGNYGNTQSDAFPPPMDYRDKLTQMCNACPCPDLEIIFEKQTAASDDTLRARVLLRYTGIVPTALGALGVALTLKYDYDPDKIIDSLTQVTPDINPNNRMHVVATHTKAVATGLLPKAGRIEFAAAGRAQNVFIATDTLFTVQFIVVDEIIRGGLTEFFTLTIDSADVLIINRLEERVCLGRIFRDSVLITSPVVEPRRRQPLVLIAPNPATTVLAFESPESPMEKIDIRSLTGAHVLSVETGGQHRFELPVGALPPGIWLAFVQTKKGVAVKKFIREQ